jgi:hypothetical protein
VKAREFSTADVLDDTGDLVSQVGVPWMAVLCLAALPLRLVQADFLSRLIALGAEASRYGHLLQALAVAAAAGLVVATLGRAVFARACLLAIRTGARPGRAALAVGLTPFLSHLYVALVSEILFFTVGLTIVLAPLAITLSALAAAVAPLAERPGLGAPWRLVAASSVRVGVLVGLQILFAIAFVIAFINVGVAFHVGLWLAGAVPGLDLAVWAHRLSPGSARFLLLAATGACLVIDPFWVAAHVVYVHRLRARETGEDLRAWFERLRAATAA